MSNLLALCLWQETDGDDDFNLTLLSLVLFNWSFVVLGNGILKMLNDIYLPSLPVSILYPIFTLLCLLLVSNFVIINDLILLKSSDFIVNLIYSYLLQFTCYVRLSRCPTTFYALPYLSCLSTCFASVHFCILCGRGSAFYIHRMSWYMKDIIWVGGLFCSICIWWFSILVGFLSAVVCIFDLYFWPCFVYSIKFFSVPYVFQLCCLWPFGCQHFGQYKALFTFHFSTSFIVVSFL